MLRLGLIIALVAACGGGSDKHDAGPSGDDDAGGGSDAGPNPQCVPAALPACTNPVAGTKLSLRQVGDSFADGAVLAASPPNDPRLFVVQRNGQIKIVSNEVVAATPFFDLNGSDAEFVSETNTGERGLLGLAFHPEYKCNGEFFIYYTTSTHDVISRCTVSTADANVANTTCTTVLAVPDPYENHNGGMMEFGADGYLYVGIGDGGSAGDPKRNAQSLTPINQGGTLGSTALLGKFLRLDIDHKDTGKEYGIPASNPYATGGGEPEIWMVGVRNPWRWSFDKATGDLWIGDVGQNLVEELDVLKAGEQSGKNLGWSVWEANTCCTLQTDKCNQSGTQQTCDMNAPGLVFPKDIHNHSEGWISVIGGEVYHGTCMPDLQGWFFYTDYQSQNAGMHRARLKTDGTLEFANYALNSPTLPDHISSIHADANGELWATTAGSSAKLYKIETTP
ncbi:MAG TPA: PQQ-dependent sugar dehydrogenase [Kofleriaceae bacterium]|jgi:hypothetical protein